MSVRILWPLYLGILYLTVSIRTWFYCFLCYWLLWLLSCSGMASSCWKYLEIFLKGIIIIHLSVCKVNVLKLSKDPSSFASCLTPQLKCPVLHDVYRKAGLYRTCFIAVVIIQAWQMWSQCSVNKPDTSPSSLQARAENWLMPGTVLILDSPIKFVFMQVSCLSKYLPEFTNFLPSSQHYRPSDAAA